MRAILFGATGMIGQGTLRELLLDPEVTEVLVIGRTPIGQTHAKLREHVLKDPSDLSPIEGELGAYDACLFCLGVSAAGLSEEKYRAISYDMTLRVGEKLREKSPKMRFLYVSGAGTDGSEKGFAMWARVKGATENALLRIYGDDGYMMRPGVIQPMHGFVSKTGWYRALYATMGVLFPVAKAVAPNHVMTAEELGRAMVSVAKKGHAKHVLEARDIIAVGRG